MTNNQREPERLTLATQAESVRPRLIAARFDALNYRGTATALEPPLIGIVGTRDPDGTGLTLARRFAAAIVSRDLTVVSGGALGIDAAAHASALEARGRTVVVLPCGVDRVYPLRHAALYREIVARGGALVSPFPDGTPPTRWTFPRRNLLLASLCDIVVVVQAPSNSGSLIAAEAARKLGRRVLVVPAAPGDRRGGGCLALLRTGAELCATVDDLRRALDRLDGPLLPEIVEPVRARPARQRPKRERTLFESADERATERAPYALDAAQQRVYDALVGPPVHIDMLAKKMGEGAASLRASLVLLTMLGLVTERTDGTFART